MDEIDRLELLFDSVDESRKELFDRLHIDYSRFAQVLGRKVSLRARELIDIAAAFPAFEYWILTGKEIPAVGQIRPMTKQEEREWWADITKKTIEYMGDVDALLNHLLNLQMKYSLRLKGGVLSRGAINKWANGDIPPRPESRVLLLLICKETIWVPKIREAIYIYGLWKQAFPKTTPKSFAAEFRLKSMRYIKLE